MEGFDVGFRVAADDERHAEDGAALGLEGGDDVVVVAGAVETAEDDDDEEFGQGRCHHGEGSTVGYDGSLKRMPLHGTYEQEIVVRARRAARCWFGLLGKRKAVWAKKGASFKVRDNYDFRRFRGHFVPCMVGIYYGLTNHLCGRREQLG